MRCFVFISDNQKISIAYYYMAIGLYIVEEIL